MGYLIPKYIISPVVRLLFLKRVKNLDVIPEKGAFILSTNHQSVLDGFLLGSIIIQKRVDIHYFVAEDWFDFPVGKFLLNFMVRNWNGLAVKPEADGPQRLLRGGKDS